MLHYNKTIPEVCIRLEPGIYKFTNMSGTGKTYLSKVLKDHAVTGEAVVVFTVEDMEKKLTLEDIISVKQIEKPEVILLDRYDRYNGYEKEVIKKYAKQAVVLIDCKGRLDIPLTRDDRLGMAGIALFENRIEVI